MLEDPAKALQGGQRGSRIELETKKHVGPQTKYFRQLGDMAGHFGWTTEKLIAIVRVAESFNSLPQAQRLLLDIGQGNRQCTMFNRHLKKSSCDTPIPHQPKKGCN